MWVKLYVIAIPSDALLMSMLWGMLFMLVVCEPFQICVTTISALILSPQVWNTISCYLILLGKVLIGELCVDNSHYSRMFSFDCESETLWKCLIIMVIKNLCTCCSLHTITKWQGAAHYMVLIQQLGGICSFHFDILFFIYGWNGILMFSMFSCN